MNAARVDTASARSSEFEGKVALVLGASRGIGAATARLFASRGARVVLASRDRAALEALRDAIRASGGEAASLPVDLTSPPTVRELAQSISREFGRLDCAFNNAGEGYQPTPLADVPPEEFEKVQRVTVQGTFLALREEIPLLLKSGGGAIVNMSSTAGISGYYGGGPYITAKHAIIGLTKSAALDYAQKGVRVNVLAPGPIDTDRIRALPEEYRERTRQAVPMRRIGDPEDVGRTVLWLCSEESRFITGSTVVVDGGRLAGFA
jgi:NAD(P)-dependent dehydrogenase (short-subunit alcohol dehydrogenase family)